MRIPRDTNRSQHFKPFNANGLANCMPLHAKPPLADSLCASPTRHGVALPVTSPAARLASCSLAPSALHRFASVHARRRRAVACGSCEELLGDELFEGLIADDDA